MEATSQQIALKPDERALAWLVREPFPSVATGTSMRAGKIARGSVRIISHMNDGGVIFADGIEQDFLSFDWGRSISISVSGEPLHLVRE
jgi:hypothetical protein